MTLSVKRVARISKPGRYADGHGLYLQVTTPTSRSWIFRYERGGRERWMGLGSLHTFTLDEARAAARKARQKLHEGVDPLADRRQTQEAIARQDARTRTFRVCAEDYFSFTQDKWRNADWRRQFGTSMRAYVYPKIGHVVVADVDTAEVLRCIEPLWKTKTPTANKVRRRIEDVLDWATVHKYREGPNPAKWEGNLEHVLHKQNGSANHHDALPYAEMPDFMAALRAVDGIAERALEMLCLTAMRSGEVRLAKWDEFDLKSATWTVPAARMKMGREHRVPLPDRAVQMLRALPRLDGGVHVFPGEKAGKPISPSALPRALKQLGRDCTVHGFRSTFRDWCAEQTAFPHDVVEMSLAHSVGTKAEQAYRRTDLLDKRSRLMQEWSAYCAGAAKAKAGAVVPLRRGRR